MAAPERVVSKRKVFYAALLTIGVLGFIPQPTNVTGRAEVVLRDDNRQAVKMHESGTVTLSVTPHQAVKRGDIVAIIENNDLMTELHESQQRLAEARQAVETAQRRLFIAQAELDRSGVDERTSGMLARRQDANLDRIDAGIGTSEIQRLEAEIDGTRSRAQQQRNEGQRLDSEIAELQGRQETLRGQLALLQEQYDDVLGRVTDADFQEALDRGALSRNSPIVTSLKERQYDLEARIADTENEIVAIDEQMSQRRTLQASATSEIDRARAQESALRSQIKGEVSRTEETAIRERGAWQNSLAGYESALEAVNVAIEEIETQSEIARFHEARIAQLEERRDGLEIKARIDGIVITEDLDLKNEQWAEQGETLFSIAPSEIYDIEVRVDQGDIGLFSEGDRATFVNDTPGVDSVSGQVKTIERVLDDETTAGDEAKQEVTVEPDESANNPALSPNAKGFVHIRSPKNLNLYQKIALQLGKVVNVSRYMPWVTGK